MTAALGDLAKDIITGFTGVVVQYDQHMHGCDRLHLEPRELNEQGAPKDAYVFDIQRLEVLEEDVVPPVPLSEGADKFTLGARVKDKITGYEGIVGVISTLITGIVALTVEPGKMDKDGTRPMRGVAFHTTQVELVEHKPVPVVSDAPKKPGGPSESRSPTKSERF